MVWERRELHRKYLPLSFCLHALSYSLGKSPLIFSLDLRRLLTRVLVSTLHSRWTFLTCTFSCVFSRYCSPYHIECFSLSYTRTFSYPSSPVLLSPALIPWYCSVQLNTAYLVTWTGAYRTARMFQTFLPKHHHRISRYCHYNTLLPSSSLFGRFNRLKSFWVTLLQLSTTRYSHRRNYRVFTFYSHILPSRADCTQHSTINETSWLYNEAAKSTPLAVSPLLVIYSE